MLPVDCAEESGLGRYPSSTSVNIFKITIWRLTQSAVAGDIIFKLSPPLVPHFLFLRLIIYLCSAIIPSMRLSEMHGRSLHGFKFRIRPYHVGNLTDSSSKIGAMSLLLYILFLFTACIIIKSLWNLITKHYSFTSVISISFDKNNHFWILSILSWHDFSLWFIPRRMCNVILHRCRNND